MENTNQEKETNPLEYLGIVLLVFIFLSGLFEIGLLIYAYVNADKVECNLLWCTFTSGHSIEIDNSYQNITQSITSSSQCFINGDKVNCSEIDNYKSNLDKLIPQ